MAVNPYQNDSVCLQMGQWEESEVELGGRIAAEHDTSLSVSPHTEVTGGTGGRGSPGHSEGTGIIAQKIPVHPPRLPVFRTDDACDVAESRVRIQPFSPASPGREAPPMYERPPSFHHQDDSGGRTGFPDDVTCVTKMQLPRSLGGTITLGEPIVQPDGERLVDIAERHPSARAAEQGPLAEADCHVKPGKRERPPSPAFSTGSSSSEDIPIVQLNGVELELEALPQHGPRMSEWAVAEVCSGNEGTSDLFRPKAPRNVPAEVAATAPMPKSRPRENQKDQTIPEAASRQQQNKQYDKMEDRARAEEREMSPSPACSTGSSGSDDIPIILLNGVELQLETLPRHGPRMSEWAAAEACAGNEGALAPICANGLHDCAE